MPASIAHFVNLIDTYHGLKFNGKGSKSDPFKAEPIKKNTLGSAKDQGISQYAYLGSIFPDLPYYHKDGKTTFAADFFHYNLSGTYAIKLIDYAIGKGVGSASGNRLLALALGFITHIAADVVCHPYINTIAGAYWDQLVPFIDKIDVPLLPGKKAGKVSMHMMTETHQDAFLAIDYFKLKDLSTTGASKSWSDFINDLSLGIFVPWRKDDMEDLFKDVCRCFREVYGETLNEDYLWNAGNIIFESLDGSYDRALFPFPDRPSYNLVNYGYRKHDYKFYLAKATALSQALCTKALDYVHGGQSEKDSLKKYLKNWNLDMGYTLKLEAKMSNNVLEVHVKCEHSWCHNYGKYDMP